MVMAFVVLFALSRILVLLIMTHTIPTLYMRIGNVHIHHFVYGIFLMAGVGAYLLFRSPVAGSRGKAIASYIFGMGLALTFDEFDMWLHLGGSYYSQLSFDAVVTIILVLVMYIILINLERFGIDTWIEVAITAGVMLLVTAIIVAGIHKYRGSVIHERLQVIELKSPA